MKTEKDPYISIIVPALNEERYIRFLFHSLGDQRSTNYETLVVDGGSRDRTSDISNDHKARVIVLPGHGEFISRNFGAKMAKGTLLLLTCADVIFPEGLLRKIVEKFEEHPDLIALTGPGCPYDAPLIGKLEYAVYNFARYLFAKFPKPLKRFSTSTNFLVVRKDCFDKTGGFAVNDINADGLMGRKLLEMGEVGFFLDTYIYLSARRMRNMGLIAFNRHYLYAFENFLFFASNAKAIRSFKVSSKKKHRKMREA